MRKKPNNGVNPLFLIILIIMIVVMIVTPIPKFLLEYMILLNLSAWLLILLVRYMKKTLKFSIFPTLLFVTKLSSIALVVSAARLILINVLSPL